MLLLTIFVPLINFFVFLFVPRATPKQFLLLQAPLALITLASWLTLFTRCIISEESEYITLGTWMSSGLFEVKWAFGADTLTYVMLVVVLTVSAFVHLYSLDYMAEDPHLFRFMSYLSLFTFFMIILVTSTNFVVLFLGWEGVGLCSYLLISFWCTRIQASKAAIKAMIVNRIADLALTVGIILIFYVFRSVEFYVVFGLAPYLAQVPLVPGFHTGSTLFLIGLLLLIGAMGKSAQLGFHTWLPDAMEGPTPVSALIHAATMVTAGIFLIIRCAPLFDQTPRVLLIIGLVGAGTTFMAASIGLVQNDIKKVIAYSTCSQLGYMMFVCSLSGYALSLCHLANHAFFKALLFLSAGAAIHAISNEQDLRRLGALHWFLPVTYAMMFIGSAALMGTPFLTGFYSKDVILENAVSIIKPSSLFTYWLGLMTAFITSFYSFRLLFLAFYYQNRSPKPYIIKTHELSVKMAVSLAVLCIGSIFFGYLTREAILGLGVNFWNGAVLVPSTYTENQYEAEFLPFLIKGLPLFGSLLSVLCVFTLGDTLVWPFRYFYKSQMFRDLYRFLSSKWHFDVVYNRLINETLLHLSFSVFSLMDKGILELFGPTGVKRVTSNAGATINSFQTGRVHDYGVFMVFHLFAIWIFISAHTHVHNLQVYDAFIAFVWQHLPDDFVGTTALLGLGIASNGSRWSWKEKFYLFFMLVYGWAVTYFLRFFGEIYCYFIGSFVYFFVWIGCCSKFSYFIILHFASNIFATILLALAIVCLYAYAAHNDMVTDGASCLVFWREMYFGCLLVYHVVWSKTIPWEFMQSHPLWIDNRVEIFTLRDMPFLAWNNTVLEFGRASHYNAVIAYGKATAIWENDIHGEVLQAFFDNLGVLMFELGVVVSLKMHAPAEISVLFLQCLYIGAGIAAIVLYNFVRLDIIDKNPRISEKLVCLILFCGYLYNVYNGYCLTEYINFDDTTTLVSGLASLLRCIIGAFIAIRYIGIWDVDTKGSSRFYGVLTTCFLATLWLHPGVAAVADFFTGLVSTVKNTIFALVFGLISWFKGESFQALIKLVCLLVAVAYYTLAERKIMGALQRRQGPNVVGWWGLLQPVSDGLKLLVKDVITPSYASARLFIAVPVLVLLLSLLPWTVIPFDCREITPVNTTALLSYGILIIFAISSLSAYSIILAGWSSNSKYAFIGALRSAAQMISYEVSLGLSILPVVLMSNSFSFSEIVNTQARYGWFCFSLFPLMIIFFISMLAETNRTPFDLVEAEAELVAGYHVEYSSIFFALFFLGEYGNMIVTSALMTILFFGGWTLPWGIIGSPVLIMVLKMLFFCFLFILVRATFPRYRYDQLMDIGWKIFLPVTTGYLVFIVSFLACL